MSGPPFTSPAPPGSGAVWRVGRCLVFPGARRVVIDGVETRLGGRAFDLLMVLIEHAGRVACKQMLYDRIWPGLAVEPNNLQVQIHVLRRLLGPQALETVARRGYQLVAPVEQLTGVPAFDDGAALRSAGVEADADALQHLLGQIARRLAQVPLLWLTGADAASAQRVASLAARAYARRAGIGLWSATEPGGSPPSRQDRALLVRLAEAGGVLMLHADAMPAWTPLVAELPWPHALRVLASADEAPAGATDADVFSLPPSLPAATTADRDALLSPGATRLRRQARPVAAAH